jgi:hypothetical protein
MRQILFFIAITIVACSNNTKQNNLKNFEVSQKLSSGKSFYVKDSAMYSRIFLNELKEDLDRNYESMKLIEDKLFITRKLNNELKEEIIKIPSFLPLNVKAKYVTNSDTCKFELLLKMKNFTTFTYELLEKNKTLENGEATIIESFYLGSETLIDDNGITIGAYDYMTTDKDKNHIRLSMDGKYAEISIERIPTLKKE